MRKTGPLLVAALMISGAAHADPVTVSVNTARVYVVGGVDPFALFTAWWTVPGGPAVDGFITSGDFFDPQPFLRLCAACQSGETFSPTITVGGDPFGIMDARVGPNDNLTHRWPRALASGQFVLSAGSITLPAEAPEIFNVFFPAVLRGVLRGSVDGSTVVLIEPFSFPGTAHVQFRTTPLPSGGRSFTAQGFDYIGSDFSGSEPVPELGTLILLGTGLAGIAARRFRC